MSHPTHPMIELQRAEIQRLREQLRTARAPTPPDDLRRRLQRAQTEAARQKARAEMWKHRATKKPKATK